MRFIENRPLAFAVLAVVIVASILLSGGGALNNDRIDVLGVFYADMGVNSDLDARAEAAYNLASASSRYDAVDVALVEAVSKAREALLATGSIAGKYTANAILAQAVEDLYTELQDSSLSGTDAEFVRKQYKEFKSRGDIIAHTANDAEAGANDKNRGYNFKAEAFNAVLSTFPANAIGGLFGVGPLELFR